MRRGLLVIVAAMGCRGGERPETETAPSPTRDAGSADAGSPDAGASGLGTRPRGSGGTPAVVDAASVRCPDLVNGVWVAKTFAPGPQRWHEHRLSISDDGSDTLRIEQTTRIWNGGADHPLPSLCPSGGPSWGIYHMADRGRFVDGILQVWGVELQSSTHSCGGDLIGYNLDSFTGRVHRDQYAAHNNDGAEAVNRPYNFRRISCTPD